MDHEDYSDILEDIIDCCFYSNVKPRIKISHFRQLTEILIRKLLSIDKNKKNNARQFRFKRKTCTSLCI